MAETIGPGEAARRLGVSSRTVQRWLRTGRLPAVQVGQRVKVDSAAVVWGAAGVPDRASLGPPGTRQRPIRRLLVANRGELVVRIARTCRRLGIGCLALVTEDQRSTWWAAQLDEVVPLPAPATYLDGPAIVAAALAVGADAIHPGYGFLAERPEFAEQVLAAGLTWVGPPPSAMRALGDKAAARRLAAKVSVPIATGYEGRGQSDDVLARAARRIGYPMLIKPSAGGGGKGMHLVEGAAELRASLATARREALTAFGDERVILERSIERPRHVEVQLLADRHGAVIHLGERDCSLQRRHQKVVEEAPAPGVDAALRDRLGEAAIRLARAAGYEGAGTAEFLLAPDGTFVFLELNARLQVEHPVTEAVTGLDLVELQLRVAAGEPLPLGQADVRLEGHAIEARLYAEAPWAGFLPVEGRILAVDWPVGERLRIDAGIGPGDEAGLRYDPLLAKIIASGPDRGGALDRLAEALATASVVGVDTNRGFLRWLLTLPETRSGAATTETIEASWRRSSTALADEAWSAAATALARVLRRSHEGSDSALPAAPLGFRLNAAPVLRLAFEAEPARAVPLPAEPDAQYRWAATADGTVVLDVDGRRVVARLAAPPSMERTARPGVDGGAAGSESGESGEPVRAPMPGTVLSVAVVEGQPVAAHQVLVVLEAMKMENAVTAPVDGRVARVAVRAGQTVRRDDPLVLLES